MPLPLIVGVTGASGIIYAEKLLRLLRELGISNYLIISKAAEMTIGYESSLSLSEFKELGDEVLPIQDIGALCASGSVLTRGMVILPCSMNTLGLVANGISQNLICRSAEVTLKERRRLVLMARETPLTASHIDNMGKVTLMGGIICPPMPAFYAKPGSLDEMVEYSVARLLELFGIESADLKRWRV